MSRKVESEVEFAQVLSEVVPGYQQQSRNLQLHGLCLECLVYLLRGY